MAELTTSTAPPAAPGSTRPAEHLPRRAHPPTQAIPPWDPERELGELRGGRTRRDELQPWLIVAGLMLVALGVRLLLVRGIWVDEAISIHQAQMSLGGMLDDLRNTDNHPPLHHLLLWLTTRAVGTGELAVRLPSIAAGTLLVPALFLAGRELFDRRAGLLAAALGAVAPLLVWYAQEARMYALVMLLATLAVWAQMRVLNDGRPRFWLAYGALTVAMLYTNYFTVIPIAIQQVAFAVAAWRRAGRGEPVGPLLTGYWITWIALVAAVAPLAPFALDQFQNNQASGFSNAPSAGSAAAPDGSSASVYALLSNLAWSIWGYHANATMLAIAALWPLLMLASLLSLGRGRSPSTTLLLALGLGPVLALALIGLAKRELFEVRYFAAAVPMIILLLARAATAEHTRRLPAAFAAGLLLVSMAVGLVDQQLSNNPRKYDFRGTLEQVNERSGPEDTILFAPNYLRDVVGYYGSDASSEPIPGPGEEPPQGGRVFIVASFLDDPELAGRVATVRQALIDSGRKLTEANEGKRISTWEFR